MKKLIIYILIVLSWQAKAQQDPMFSHYMYNTLAYNPAYAGYRKALSVSLLHRSQWVGFKGAPISQALTIHSPIYQDKLAAGLTVVHDKIGPTQNFAVYGDLAYVLKLNEKSKLSFGLKGGMNVIQNTLTTLKLSDDQADVAFQENVNNRLLPNCGFGMFYYNERFYAGISTPRLVESELSVDPSNPSKDNKLRRHYFLIGGANFKVNEFWEAKPSMLIKATVGAPVQLELSTLLEYREQFNFGVLYRTGDAVGVIAGVKATKQLEVSYSFDWSFGLKSGRYNAGSHELMLRYDFVQKDKARIRSPRYF